MASGEPARTQQSRKSMILKQRLWIFSFPAAPAPQRRVRMSETQAENQPEALQSACSACKTLGSRAGTWLRGGRKDWHMSPASPCVTHTPTLWFCSLLSLQGHPRNPLLKPSCLCLQQLPSISISEPSQKRSRGLSSCGQSRGTQTNSPCQAQGSSEPHPSHSDHGHVQLPTLQGTSSTPAPTAGPGLNLPAAAPRPGKEQALDPKAGRTLGLTPSPVSSRSSHQAQLGH